MTIREILYVLFEHPYLLMKLFVGETFDGSCVILQAVSFDHSRLRISKFAGHVYFYLFAKMVVALVLQYELA